MILGDDRIPPVKRRRKKARCPLDARLDVNFEVIFIINAELDDDSIDVECAGRP